MPPRPLTATCGGSEMDEPLLSGAEPPVPRRRVRSDALARADRAWRVRVAGGTWADAAEVGGYASPQNALRGVRDTFGELPAVTRDDLRDVWRARLEVMWRYAQRDAAEGKTGAIVAGVRVAQAAALIDGLNAPTEFVVHEPTQREIESWVMTVVQMASPLPEEHDVISIE